MVVFVCPVFASSTDGTIDSTYKYAWNENAGLINFGATQGNVHITDSGLTGYAWSENTGWINLNPASSGVVNDGEGNLSGYGWSQNMGWINFAPTNGGVTIDSNGEFSGSAFGESIGWIFFNDTYKVVTDWRPQSARPACNNALDDDSDGLVDYPADLGCESLTDDNEINPSGLPPSIYNPPTPPAPTPEAPAGFNISINSGNEYTNKKEVVLKLSGGPDAKKMAISNFSDFRGASQIPFQEEISWELDQAETENEYTVYAKFYTRYGQPSDVISDTIILDDISPQPPIIIYPSNGSVVKIDKPSFAGTAEKQSQITLELLSGQKTLSNATLLLDKEGKWSYSIPMPLADGNYQLKVYAKDEAENISKTAISNFSIQTFVWPTEPAATQETEPKAEPSAEPTVEEPTNQPSAVPATEEPAIPQAQPSAEPTEEPTEEPTATTPNEEPSSAPASTSTTEPASQPTTQPETSGTPQTETQPQIKPEEVVVKSVYGNFNLAPVVSTDPKAEEETISAIHAFPSQTVIFSVKPAKPVSGVSGQILFSGKTAQLEPKEQQENLSFQSFIDFLKPAPALAQSETEETSPVDGGWKMQEFTYLDENNDGIYQAEVQLPAAVNPYTLKTLLYYKDGTLKSLDTPILIDPQGYVYEKVKNQELRINKAVVSLYYLNTETKQFELWDASSYGQKNPQTIDKDGAYSFLAPQGKYYITVQAEGYHPFESQKFDVQEGVPIVNLNLELQKEVKFEFDWTAAAIVFAMGMIGLFIAGWLIKKRKKQD